MYIAQSIRASLAHPCNRAEVYRKAHLFPKLFINSFPEEQRKEARKAFSLVLARAFELDKDFQLLIAEWLENPESFKMPEFILQNEEVWMRLAEWLAFGNGDIERALPTSLYEEAKEAALTTLREELEP